MLQTTIILSVLVFSIVILILVVLLSLAEKKLLPQDTEKIISQAENYIKKR